MKDETPIVTEIKASKSGVFRFRTITLVVGIIAALLLTFIADPETIALFQIPLGTSTLLLVKSLAYFALAVGVIHVGFKGMFDYIDRSTIIDRSVREGNGGQIFIGLAIFALAYAWVFSALIGLN